MSKEEISRLEAERLKIIDFHQFPEANNFYYFSKKNKELTSIDFFTHTIQNVEPKTLFWIWLKYIDKIHLSLSQNWSRSFSLHKKIRQSFFFLSRVIPGLKIFLFISFSRAGCDSSAVRRLFSSINYKLFRVINISICARKRDSYITESDMVQMKIYTFKNGETWQKDVGNHVLYECKRVTYGNEFIF